MDTTADTYAARRAEIETYFDRTAVHAWERLTSDAPVGRIRATVREGRDTMRATLLSWLPEDLTGLRILDAGCGTGALAVEAARRGAEVVAVDLSPTLIRLANDRMPHDLRGRLSFHVGDMLDPALGTFDHAVCMDSLIHYDTADAVRMLAGLSARARASVVFTLAPRTPALAMMHGIGRLFPRGDRAPSIEPVGMDAFRRRAAADASLEGWRLARTERVSRGFYISQALEAVGPCRA